MDYTKYDYNAVVASITEKLAAAEGWGEGFQSSTGQLLIQLFADTTDSLTYLLERRTQEGFLSTARLQSSIFAHASEIGYRPRRVVSATGELTLVLQDESGDVKVALDDVIIPKNTKVSLVAPPIDFVTTEDVTILAGQSTAVLPIKEGILTTLTIDATVEPFLSNRDVVIEDYRLIEEYSIGVSDDYATFYDVDSAEGNELSFGALSYAKSNTNVYDIKYAREGMRLVFGDNIFGRTPDGNINIEYIVSQEQTKSILNTGLEFEFEEDVLYDVSGTLPLEEYNYSLTNSSQITGYLPPETTLSIAKNAPIFASTNKRGVINADYTFYGKRSGIGGIVDVNTFGEHELNSLIFRMNNVFITYATSELTELNPVQDQAFRDYMDRFKANIPHLVINAAAELPVVLNITLKKNTQLPISNEELYKFIKGKIESFFLISEGSIGKDLQHSELVEFLQNLVFPVGALKYPITDFVKVIITPEFPLPTPLPTQVFDNRIKLDSSYAVNGGDIWNIVIDGNSLDVIVLGGDTHEALTERMRVKISNATPFSTETYVVDGHQFIRVLSPNYVVFDIDVSGGDLSAFVTTNKITEIPKSNENFYNAEKLIVPGSGRIVDSSGAVIFQDDGLGFLVPDVGASIPIDYQKSTLSDVYYPDGGETYFFRFEQDTYNNVYVSQRGVLSLSPFSEFGATALKSTISII